MCVLLALMFPKQNEKLRFVLLKMLSLAAVSAVVQIACHILSLEYPPSLKYSFSLRYILLMGATGIVFSHFILGGKLRLKFSVILHYLVSVLMIQYFGTIASYAIYGPNIVSSFSPREQFISTAFIHPFMLLLAVYLYLERKRLPYVASIQCRMLDFCSIACLTIAFLSNAYFFSDSDNRVMAMVLLLCFLVLHNMLYFQALRIAEERQEKYDKLQLAQRLELQLQHSREMDSMYEKMRQIRHEIKNQSAYLNYLIDSQRYEELHGLCRQMSEDTRQFKSYVDCGNPLVNSILNSKMGYAETLSIPIKVSAVVPENLEIDGSRLCCVLSNMMDNAIEASLEVEAADISVRLTMQKAYLCIHVENKASHDVLASNPNLLTSKADKDIHGYGIKNIRQIVEQYNGMMSAAMNQDRFSLIVMLQNTTLPILQKHA